MSDEVRKLTIEGGVDGNTKTFETGEGKIEIPTIEAYEIMSCILEGIKDDLKDVRREESENVRATAYIGDNSELLDDEEFQEVLQQNKESYARSEALGEMVRAIDKHLVGILKEES